MNTCGEVQFERLRHSFFFLVALILVSCGGDSPTEPVNCVGQTSVLANDPAYVARTEPLTSAPGRLATNCGINPRYCYYLGDVRVYTLGSDSVLDGFVNQQVLIVGKAVFPAEGPGELWAGTVCRIAF